MCTATPQVIVRIFSRLLKASGMQTGKHLADRYCFLTWRLEIRHDNAMLILMTVVAPMALMLLVWLPWRSLEKYTVDSNSDMLSYAFLMEWLISDPCWVGPNTVEYRLCALIWLDSCTESLCASPDDVRYQGWQVLLLSVYGLVHQYHDDGLLSRWKLLVESFGNGSTSFNQPASIGGALREQLH